MMKDSKQQINKRGELKAKAICYRLTSLSIKANISSSWVFYAAKRGTGIVFGSVC